MILTVDGTAVTCTSSRVEEDGRTLVPAVAHIWKRDKYKLTFLCGDFTLEEIEEILNKIKELQTS